MRTGDVYVTLRMTGSTRTQFYTRILLIRTNGCFLTNLYSPTKAYKQACISCFFFIVTLTYDIVTAREFRIIEEKEQNFAATINIYSIAGLS